jgi:hypothetical protein
MRFTLAAAILAESSITTLASTDGDVLTRAASLMSHGSVSSRLLSQIPKLSDEDHADQIVGRGTTNKAGLSLMNKLSGGFSMSSPNNKILQKSKPSECVPRDSDASIPDEGILSCGPGQYCIESAGSGLGGFCFKSPELDQRALQENYTIIDYLLGLCTLDGENPNVTCSVCEGDPTTYTGALDCSSLSRCAAFPGLCDNGTTTADFCVGSSLGATISAPYIYTITNCTSLETPFQLAYCIGYNVNVDAVSCDVSINGVTCNSCETSYDMYGQTSCVVFDCENTELQASGSTCGYSFFVALTTAYLYGTLPCPDGCNLCGEGSYMENSSANLTFPDGLSLNCYEAQVASLLGYFAATTYCTDLASLVQIPCGCSGTTPVATPSSPPVAGPTAVTPSSPPVAGPTAVTPSSPPVAGPTAVTPSTPPVAGPTAVAPSTPPVDGGVAAPTAAPSGAYPTSTTATVLSMLGLTAIAVAGLLV